MNSKAAQLSGLSLYRILTFSLVFVLMFSAPMSSIASAQDSSGEQPDSGASTAEADGSVGGDTQAQAEDSGGDGADTESGEDETA